MADAGRLKTKVHRIRNINGTKSLAGEHTDRIYQGEKNDHHAEGTRHT